MAFPKVALVHDYLVQDGGAERVLATLQEMFPLAPTFVLIHDRSHSHPVFNDKDIRTSFLDKWPLAHRAYQWHLPLMPVAAEHLDLSGYDLIISSSISFAKGVIVDPNATHVCYCHTPTRFLWQDRLGYLNDLPQPRFIRMILPPLLHRLRQWDRIAADRPDQLITNSDISRQRIRRYYNRDAAIIYPPVDVSRIPLSTDPGTFWLAGGRLVGYKRFDLIVKAFAKLNIPLKIFGTGPELKKLYRIAGPRTTFLGHVPDMKKIELYQKCIGFISPQLEDFGITTVEAMAAGKTVITFNKGGGAETVIPGVTGEHIEAQTWEDIGDAVIRFDASRYNPYRIRAHAETFSADRFKQQLRDFIDHAISH